MKTKVYHLKVIIREGSDEFWDDINERKITGTDEVIEAVKNALSDVGFDEEYAGTIVDLEKYELEGEN